jgi:hypothetical protein
VQVGDLVKLRFGGHRSFPLPDSVGIVVEEYHLNSARAHPYSEMRVQWLDDSGKDVSWVLRKDLEEVSASR